MKFDAKKALFVNSASTFVIFVSFVVERICRKRVQDAAFMVSFRDLSRQNRSGFSGARRRIQNEISHARAKVSVVKAESLSPVLWVFLLTSEYPRSYMNCSFFASFAHLFKEIPPPLFFIRPFRP